MHCHTGGHRNTATSLNPASTTLQIDDDDRTPTWKRIFGQASVGCWLLRAALGLLDQRWFPGVYYPPYPNLQGCQFQRASAERSAQGVLTAAEQQPWSTAL